MRGGEEVEVLAIQLQVDRPETQNLHWGKTAMRRVGGVRGTIAAKPCSMQAPHTTPPRPPCIWFA